MPRYIELDLEVLHMTSDAICLTDGDSTDWVPFSLIKDSWDISFDDIGRTKTFEIEEWRAISGGFV